MNVTYQTVESIHEYKLERKEMSTELQQNLASFRRSLGSGGFELRQTDQDQNEGVIISSGRSYMEDRDPKTWVEVVHEFFQSERM